MISGIFWFHERSQNQSLRDIYGMFHFFGYEPVFPGWTLENVKLARKEHDNEQNDTAAGRQYDGFQLVRNQSADGRRRCRSDWHDSDPAAEWSVWLTNRKAALAAYTYYKNHRLHYGNRWTPIRCVRVFGRTSISRHELVPVFPLYTNCLRYGWL